MNSKSNGEHTSSVCPVCLKIIPAQRIQVGDRLYLHKSCPDHGDFNTKVWSGTPAYNAWYREKIPSHPKNPQTAVENGCPYDCGLCEEHRQQPCCVLLEVTQSCDLGCPVCFASSQGTPAPHDFPSLETIEAWYQSLIKAGGPFNIQLSGGEPCLREDLPEIIRLGRQYGFSFFQVNTNGRRLAKDPVYLTKLIEAGLSTVYLQFDGTKDDIYTRIRGRALLEEKIQAIENCRDQGVGVMLVPTLVPGVNTDNLGEMLRFALRYHPSVRGIHFQPISFFGRYPGDPCDEDRISLPEVIHNLAEQSGGLLQVDQFKPSGGSHSACAFQGNFVVMPDGRLIGTSRFQPASSCCQPESAQENRLRSQSFVARNWKSPNVIAPARDAGPSLGEWDIVLERSKTHLLVLSGMAFQDAWTLDLDRLKECYIMIVAPDGRLIPFCAYNLTSRDGRTLHRGKTKLAKSIEDQGLRMKY